MGRDPTPLNLFHHLLRQGYGGQEGFDGRGIKVEDLGRLRRGGLNDKRVRTDPPASLSQGSMKMHSPGHSSAASITSSINASGNRAVPRAPSTLCECVPSIAAHVQSSRSSSSGARSKITDVPKCFFSSLTTHNPSDRATKTSGQISSQMPSPVHKSWSIQTCTAITSFTAVRPPSLYSSMR